MGEVGIAAIGGIGLLLVVASVVKAAKKSGKVNEKIVKIYYKILVPTIILVFVIKYWNEFESYYKNRGFNTANLDVEFVKSQLLNTNYILDNAIIFFVLFLTLYLSRLIYRDLFKKLSKPKAEREQEEIIPKSEEEVDRDIIMGARNLAGQYIGFEKARPMELKGDYYWEGAARRVNGTVKGYIRTVEEEEDLQNTVEGKDDELAIIDGMITKFYKSFISFKDALEVCNLLIDIDSKLPSCEMTKEEFEKKLKEYTDEKWRAVSLRQSYSGKIQPHIGKDDPSDYAQMNFWDRKSDDASSKIRALRKEYGQEEKRKLKYTIINLINLINGKYNICKGIVQTIENEHFKKAEAEWISDTGDGPFPGLSLTSDNFIYHRALRVLILDLKTFLDDIHPLI